MAFDLTLARGGFGEPNDTTVMQYRLFYQQYFSMSVRANPATQTNWYNEMVAAFGPNIDGYAAFSRLDEHTRQRLLEFGRCVMERQVWSFMALGPRAPEQFLIDSHLNNFLRKPQREVDAILMRSEFNHITERGDDPALCAIALTALGLPSTPTALFKDWDKRTARVVLNFQRLYGSAFESIANTDDNQLDYQNVATGARLSAQSRHDETFMQFMDFHSWLAEATYWHALPVALFDRITQTDIGTDALDANQTEALELFSLLRGIGQVSGKQRHMDLKKATYFAELAGYGYLPAMAVQLFGIVETRRARDATGNLIPGLIAAGVNTMGGVIGSHPDDDTWVDNGIGQDYYHVARIIDGHTPDFIEVVFDLPQPAPGVKWIDFTNVVPVDADTYTRVSAVDIGGKTRWTCTATKAAKWTGIAAFGNFKVAHGAHQQFSPAKGIVAEIVSVTVMDGATDLSAFYDHLPSRALTGLQFPPTRTPRFPLRESGTPDIA